jgi:hypothetical protein
VFSLLSERRGALCANVTKLAQDFQMMTQDFATLTQDFTMLVQDFTKLIQDFSGGIRYNKKSRMQIGWRHFNGI